MAPQLWLLRHGEAVPHESKPDADRELTPRGERQSIAAGKGLANPVAQIWTGALMLEHLGHAEAAQAVVSAIERVVEEGKTLTRDLGGKATTAEVGQAIAALV